MALNRNGRRCAIAGTVIFGLFTLLLLGASYVAINAIHDPWHAVDYWLAWFSGLSLLGSGICAIVFGVNLCLALNCDLNEPSYNN